MTIETLNRAVRDNEKIELRKLIKEINWQLKYHKNQLETAEVKLTAYKSQLAILEKQNV